MGGESYGGKVIIVNRNTVVIYAEREKEREREIISKGKDYSELLCGCYFSLSFLFSLSSSLLHLLMPHLVYTCYSTYNLFLTIHTYIHTYTYRGNNHVIKKGILVCMYAYLHDRVV